MLLNWVKKVFNSVFTKMLAIILVMGICINLALWGFFGAYRAMAGRPFRSNIYQYLNYVVADLGTPPDYQRARNLADQTALQIHYLGPETSWSTSPRPLKRQEIHLRSWPNQANIRGGMYHGRFYVEYRHVNGLFLFELSGEYHKNPALKRVHGLIFITIALILLGSYWLIRRILKPVRLLDSGVKAVGRGDLQHRVTVTKSDELGQLARAFNDMIERLQTMLAAKEQLLRDVSHELRSPLTRMKVALEFVEAGQTKELLQADIHEIEKLISQILDTARIHHEHSRLNLQPTDLAKLIQEVTAAYQNQGPGLIVQEIRSEITCKLDPERIKMVFKNLIENAIKYSSKDSQPVAISISERKDRVDIVVSDHGIGIEPEALLHIWEPFYRADKSRTRETGGYGLGLSLCKTIVEAHGGQIDIRSTPGKGTQVSFSLPIKP